MGDNLRKLFIFMAGTVVGSAVTWKIAKSKYEQIANEEIQSVKDLYSKRHEEIKEDIDSEDDDEDPDTKEDESIVEDPIDDNYEEPYIISPDEFGLFEDYETITLTYYEEDGVLADENDELVEDVIETIGKNVLYRLEDYDEGSLYSNSNPDAVYVRNDRLKSDYEILKVSESYEDVTQN